MMNNTDYAASVAADIRAMYASVGKPVPGSFTITRDGQHTRYRSLEKAAADIAANRKGWTMWNASGEITNPVSLMRQHG